MLSSENSNFVGLTVTHFAAVRSDCFAAPAIVEPCAELRAQQQNFVRPRRHDQPFRMEADTVKCGCPIVHAADDIGVAQSCAGTIIVE